jgi:hypothetical protein
MSGTKRPLDPPAKQRRSAKHRLGTLCPRSALCKTADLVGGVPSFLVPKSLQEVRELARMIALAEWAPQAHRDAEGNYVQQRIELAIIHGATVGLGPIAAVQSIALINGTPTIWGDGALSLVEHSGLLEDMIERSEFDEEQGLTAICTMKRRRRRTPITNSFSIAMADHARLTHKEGPWQTYPQRMLQMRARSWTIRDGFGDVLRGLYIREEVDDFVEVRTVPQGLRSRALPRPRFSAARSSAQPPPSRPTAGVRQAEPEAERGPPVAEEPQEGEVFTLVDADGAFVEVAGLKALNERLAELLFDKKLSPARIVGVWESNEIARESISRGLGPEALALTTERVQSAQTALDAKHYIVQSTAGPETDCTALEKRAILQLGDAALPVGGPDVAA